MSLARNTAKLLLAAVAVALPLSACGRDEADLSNGKAMFTERCGSCHALARAGTQGQTGPDLDDSFRSALASGMDRETVEGVVHDQILNPRANSSMPANLVRGDDVRDVAAYVAYAAERSGEDEGQLAQAGLAGATSGEQIFTAAGCAGCHTFAKANARGTTGPSLDDLAQAGDEDYVRQSLLEPDAEIADGFSPGVMPSYEGRLNDKQIDALLQYLLGG